MLGIHDLWSFLLAASLVIIVPGPATLFVVSAARHSVRRGTRAIAGIIAGDLVLITLSGLGFAALVARWPAVLSAIKIAGALYLAYLGISLLRSHPVVRAPADADPGARADPPPVPASSHELRRGLAITLTNPKPLLFFGAFFAMFIAPAATSRIVSFYALGAMFELINLTYFATILWLVARLRATAGFEQWAAGRFNRMCGAILIGYAAVVFAAALV